MQVKRKLRGGISIDGTKILQMPKKFLFLCALFMALSGGLFAQTENDFPAGDFWSLDGGVGFSGMLEQGKSFQFVIDPKLWLSPPLMVGAKAGISYSVEGDAANPDLTATSDALFLEGQVYLRWNFLRLGKNINRKFNIFAQAGIGLAAAYRGDKNPFDNPRATRGSFLADGGVGVTIPLTDRWHIEPMVRGGYPHLWGVSLTAGYKFPLPEKTRIIEETRIEYREVLKTVPPIELVKMLAISSVEFILFGPDIGSYNLGVDDDGQALNDLVMNSTVNFLKEHPEYIVRLEGNANPVTDDPREADELMALSTHRAHTVATELEKRGVPRKQMVVMAFGGTRTVTSDQERWDMNRRVEVIIMNAEGAGE